MRILLTNFRLARPTGSELYLRDVALGLLARGHRPVLYSRELGELATRLRAATVPVVDDLDRLAEPPDVLHGQHHLETMTALARFPELPAVYLCHGFLPPEEAPPRHPAIRRYLAVDELVRERLVAEGGIAPEAVEIVPNFVDLQRFRPRPPLPARPVRALAFGNYASEDDVLPVLRRACGEAGLAFEAIGANAGRESDRPEDLLGDFDVVFAKGRAALEALAVGAAVVLADPRGLGPLVTAAELDRLRAWNLGVRLLGEPVSEAAVARELARYDAGDAAAVSRRVRAEAGLERALDRLLEVYAAALEAHRRAPPSPDQASRALAAYLRHGPLSGGDVHRADRERLRAEAARASGAAEELRRRLAREAAEADRLRRERTTLDRERRQAITAHARLEAQASDLRHRLAEQERQIAAARAELVQVLATATWRLRGWLVRRRWIVALYRRLRR